MFFRKGNTAHYYSVFLYRLLLVLVLFFLCRLCFYFLNTGLFPGIQLTEWLKILKGGLVFDIAAMFYFNSLFIVFSLLPLRRRNSKSYQRAVKYSYLIPNAVAILLNCIDFIYYRFTLRRTTRLVFDEFSNETNKGKLAGHFFTEYWYVVLVFGILVMLLAWLYSLVKIRTVKTNVRPWIFYTTATLALLITVTIAIGGIRGDFKY